MVGQVGKLEMRARVAMPPAARKLRAAMCPMLHVGVPEYVTMGGEDTAVYIYDISQQQSKGAKIVNKLQVGFLSQALVLSVSSLRQIASRSRPFMHLRQSPTIYVNPCSTSDCPSCLMIRLCHTFSMRSYEAQLLLTQGDVVVVIRVKKMFVTS